MTECKFSPANREREVNEIDMNGEPRLATIIYETNPGAPDLLRGCCERVWLARYGLRAIVNGNPWVLARYG
jgi:hypothetical protein